MFIEYELIKRPEADKICSNRKPYNQANLVKAWSFKKAISSNKCNEEYYRVKNSIIALIPGYISTLVGISLLIIIIDLILKHWKLN